MSISDDEEIEEFILTDKDIETAKNDIFKVQPDKTGYHGNHSGHHDCIRIAYIWLSVQTPADRALVSGNDVKHLIESWASRYVSEDDALLAAHMLSLVIKEDCIGVLETFTRPSVSRLSVIGEAFTNEYVEYYSVFPYNKIELDLHPFETNAGRITLELTKNQLVGITPDDYR